MKDKNRNLERGQSLVLITMMMLGLIGMLALVLDGGNVYSQRRQAQSAADAGALAAARALCDPDIPDEDYDDEANNYVTSNYADLKSVTLGPGEYEVTVETEINFDTFFLSVLGRPDLTVEALAAAQCETGGAAHVMPVAWSCRPPNYDGDGNWTPGEGCNLAVEKDDSDCTYPSKATAEDPADKFYIIFDSGSMDTVVYCAENDYDPGYGTDGFTCADCGSEGLSEAQQAYCDSDYPKCDLNCDGTSDLEILNQSSYGWLDLDGGSSDANEKKKWIEGVNVPTISIHNWLAGASGMQTDVLHEVGEEVLFESAVVPVFDDFCSKEFGVPGSSNENCTWHDDDDKVILSSVADDYFHIIGFANYKVMCVQTESGVYPKGAYPPGTKNCEINQLLVDKGFIAKNSKSIEGCFIEGVDTDIEGIGGADFDAYTLLLTR